MKPPLCICEGPTSREPNAWMWGDAHGNWFYYRDICPIHGAEYRKKVEEHNRIMNNEPRER